ncbi:MAG TPA: alpha/beta hydrolase [Deltaproteobacteria bacterium]|nr:alpha/beta hydrolase [Deltaproteobacteria bacterium]
METRKLSLSRGVFNVRDRGNENGTPFVMIHGWPETSFCWEALTPFLREDIRVIAPDLRGLGDSERTMNPDCYLKQELAKDVIEIIDALGIDSFYLAGHDWGGAVAQETAMAVPERVKKFVLMNMVVINNAEGNAEAMKIMQSMGSIPFWYQYFQQQPGLAEAMIPGNENVWVRYFFGKAGRDGRISKEAIDEYVRCYSIENTPATAAYYYRAMNRDNKHWAELAGTKFPMPSLYIYGNKDIVIIPQYLNHIESCFDDVKVVEVDAGHFLQEERPETVAALLNDFLRS